MSTTWGIATTTKTENLKLDYGGSLQSAITRIGAEDRILIVDSVALPISASVIVPATLRVVCLPGAFFSHSDPAYTITFLGDIDPGDDQIFDDPDVDWINFSAGGRMKPESWGAKADGATLNTKFIHRAVSALPATGGEIYFGAGTYLAGDAAGAGAGRITIEADNIRFTGADKNTSILKLADQQNCDLILVYTFAGTTGFNITNMTLDGNEVNQTGIGGWFESFGWGAEAVCCLNIQRGFHHVVQDNYVINGKSFGICIQGGTNAADWDRRNIVSGNIVRSIGQTLSGPFMGGHGIDIGSFYTSVIGNILSLCASAGIMQEELTIGITITGNTVSDTFYGILVTNSEKYAVVSSNCVRDTTSHGIVVEDNQPSDTGEVSLIGNTVDQAGGYGVFVNKSFNCTVSANVVSNGASAGIFVARSQHIVISSNIVHDNTYGIWLLSDATENTDKVNINSNQIFNNGLYGIFLNGESGHQVSQCIVSGNMITGNVRSGVHLVYASNNSISNNTLIGNDTGKSFANIYLVDGALDNMFIGNTLSADPVDPSIPNSNFYSYNANTGNILTANDMRIHPTNGSTHPGTSTKITGNFGYKEEGKGEYYWDSNVVPTVIETAGIPILLRHTTVAVLEGFTWHAGTTGAITAYSDGTGKTNVASGTHGLVTGDIISIRGTAHYGGVWAVTWIDADNFSIIAAWAGNDGASDWDQGDYLLVGENIDATHVISFTISISEAAPAGSDLHANLYLNAVECIKCESHISTVNNKLTFMGGHSLNTLVTGDRLSLAIDSTGTRDITIAHGDLDAH